MSRNACLTTTALRLCQQFLLERKFEGTERLAMKVTVPSTLFNHNSNCHNRRIPYLTLRQNPDPRQGNTPLVGELAVMLLYNGSDAASICGHSILQAVCPVLLQVLPNHATTEGIVSRGAEDAGKPLDPLLVEHVLLNFKQARVHVWASMWACACDTVSVWLCVCVWNLRQLSSVCKPNYLPGYNRKIVR